MGKVKECTKNEPCQKSVPIFPLRYSVKPKGEGNTFDHNLLGYPEMKHSAYTARLLRTGYVYLFDKEKNDSGLHVWEVKEDGNFQKIKALQGSIASISQSIYDKKNKYYKKEGAATPYILARAKSTEVYIGFSDALWTADIFSKIKGDKEGIRTKLMTKVDVLGWTTGDMKTTFDMDDLDLYSEEYNDENWANNFKWSPFKTNKPVNLAKAHSAIMKAYPTCETKAIGVMLYDNIGLVIDQGGIVNKYRVELQNYLQKDDSTHKKIISDCIESIYKLEISKDINGKDVEAYIAKTKESVRKANDSVYYNAANPLRQADYRTIKKVFTPKEEYESVTSKVFENHAKNRMRTVDEKARLKFLKKYEDGYKILAKKLMESKNDRWKHLSTYILPTSPLDLGSSFLNYDTSNKVAADLSGQAFALCITDIMSDPYKVEDITNKEHDLFAKWMELPKEQDPLIKALNWAYNNKPDTLMGAIDALAKLPFSEMETRNSTLEDNTKSKIDELSSQQKQEHGNLTELQQERSRLEKIISEEMDKLHAKYSNVEISKNIATYILTKPKRLNGGALTMSNRKFNEFIYSAQPNKIDSLVKNITDPKKSYSRSESLKTVYLLPEEYERKFSEAANLTTHENQKFHFKDAKDTVPVQDSVKVLTKENPFVFTVVNNTDILNTQLNIRDMGQAVQGATKSMEDISKKIDDLSQQSKYAEDVFHKEYNPFVTKLNRGLSPLVIIANAINLSRAIDSFKSDDPIEQANLAAAITGSVAALLYGIDSYQTKTSTVQMVADMKVETVASSRFFSVKSMMWKFGGVAAFFDMYTQYLKGQKAEKEDNTEARNAYYLSAFLLGVGGGLTLLSSPILIVVGVVALIGGMFALSRADDLVWDEIDKWLNACVWRKKGEEARNIPNHKAYETEWDKEYMDFIAFMFLPRVTLSWEKVSVGHPEYGNMGVAPVSKEIKIKVVLPFINHIITWGYVHSSEETKFAQCNLTLHTKTNKFTLYVDNKNPYNYQPINFSMMWSLPFRTGSSYSVESYYQLKVGGEVKKVSPRVTKQWGVVKTIGGEYGRRF